MNAEVFNTDIRKFLRKVGVTSQQEIEKAVQQAIQAGTLTGNEKLTARIVLRIEGIQLEHVMEGEIALS